MLYMHKKQTRAKKSEKNRKKCLTKGGRCGIIHKRLAAGAEKPPPKREMEVEEALEEPQKTSKKPRKNSLTSGTESAKINKLSAERRARRTLKIEQYRILVTEPLQCKEGTIKIPKE